MYLEPKDFRKAFLEIQKTSLSHSTCKLVIYVLCLSIDALCALKMLLSLFKKYLIPYQLIPVVGYSDLKTHYLKLDGDVTNVILVGCGALVDIESFFEIDPEDLLDPTGPRKFLRKVFVIDGRRPWNLDNVFGSELVVCFDDGHISENMQEEQKAYGKLLEIQRGEGEEDKEEEDEKEKENKIRIEDEDEDENDDEDNKLKRKREEILSECEEQLEEYYSQGTTIITSISTQIYSMILTLGNNENMTDTLWLSIVGATSLDNSFPQVYKRLYPLLRDEVTRLSPSAEYKKATDALYIGIDKDYHLFLLRHWTLYNSFLYLSHVNLKLYLWQEEGKKKLNKIFAKMGISLQIANQNWLYMDIDVKKRLNLIFKKYLGLYDLEDIISEGFVRYYGYKSLVSAREFVESLIALLQQDEGSEIERQPEGEEEGDNDELLKKNQQEEITRKLEEKEKKWVRNFWTSWDALSVEKIAVKKDSDQKVESIELVKQGMEAAKAYQQIIFRTGTMIMEKRLLKSLRIFRLVVLKDETIPDLAFFRNPINLTRLGLWILESLAELDNMPLLPLVLASLDVETDTYLVVGMAPLYPRDSQREFDRKKKKKKKKKSEEEEEEESLGVNKVLLNTFSVAFQQVATTTGAKVRIDSFESSVIEIRKDDLSPFLEKLTLCGLV